MKKRPVRVYFTADDPAELWREGDLADDLGPESPGSSAHLFRLDGFDIAQVVLEDPYGRGLVERLHPEEPGEEEPDVPFVAEEKKIVRLEEGEEVDVDLADRCARCSHVFVQHQPLGGSCGACGCRKFVLARYDEPDPED